MLALDRVLNQDLGALVPELDVGLRPSKRGNSELGRQFSIGLYVVAGN